MTFAEKMMRTQITALLALLLILCSEQSAVASPYVDSGWSIEISGHRWGIWSLDGTPSHDWNSKAFNGTKWITSGSGDEQTFYSYWIVGLGPYGAIYLSYRMCIALAVAVGIGIVILWRRHRRRRTSR